MISKEQLIKKLKYLNERTLSATPEHFSTTLYEFIRELDQQKILTLIKKRAAVEEEHDKGPLMKIDRELLAKLHDINDQIEYYYSDNAIPLSCGFMGKKDISEFRAYEQGNFKVDGPLIYPLMFALTNAFSFLLRLSISYEDNMEFIKTLAVIGGNGRVLKLHDTSANGLQAAFFKIKDYVSVRKIRGACLEKLINKYEGGIPETDKELNQYVTLMSTLEELRQGEVYTGHHLEFVRQFAFVNDDGQIIELLLRPTVLLWEEENQRLRRIQVTTFWYSWGQLDQFYLLYGNYEQERRKVVEEHELFREWELNYTFKKIAEIASGNESQYIQTLKIHLERVFYFIEEQALSGHPISQSENEDSTTASMSYDTSSATLTIGQHKINFPRKGMPRTILPIITKNDEAKRKDWPWDAIYEVTQYKEPPSSSKKRNEKYRRKLYHCYEHINEQVSKQSDGIIKNFLIFNMDSVHINPSLYYSS